LEFNFNYEDDRLFPEDDIDLPYLEDNEDWSNKYIGNIISQPSPQSLAGFFLLQYTLREIKLPRRGSPSVLFDIKPFLSGG
jgi:hypothetical protein